MPASIASKASASRSASRAAPPSAIAGAIEIERARRIGRVDAGRQQPLEQRGEWRQQRHEDQRQHEIECGVEVGDQPRFVRLDRHQKARDRRQKRQRDGDADDAVEEIAERNALGRRIGVARAFEPRIERRAEIGAERHRQRGERRRRPLGGERHDDQHDRGARMRRPSQRSGQNDVEDRFGVDGAEQQPQARHVLVGR